MHVTTVTPPTTTPATLAEAKAHLRILDEESDAMILSLLKSATSHIERVLGLSLMERTLRLSLDAFSDSIELKRGPVTEVLSVGYVDVDGVAQTVDPSIYSTDLLSHTQWVVRNAGMPWPETNDGLNGVSVTYKAGFTVLPDRLFDLKAAILLLTGHWFANREAVAEAKAELPLAVNAILQPYRPMLV